MGQMHMAGMNTLSAVDEWMKTIASNLTGTTVNGYRGARVEFGEVLNETIRGGAGPSQDGSIGAVNAVQRADSGTYITSTTNDFSQGSIQQSANATDLAVNGDAFFVLSKTDSPNTMDDLTFTRNGNFHFDLFKQPGGGSLHRLVNQDGLFVMGVRSTVTADWPRGALPVESSASGFGVFNGLKVPGGDVAAFAPIVVDKELNPTFTGENARFNNQGQLFNGPDPIRLLTGAGGAAQETNINLVLTKFTNPQGLRREAGASNFAFDPAAGDLFAGVAANATTRDQAGNVITNPIGSSNVLLSHSLEGANTSINTIMPELTLAQKSFSASAKIISVGNTLIDDVNNLIR